MTRRDLLAALPVVALGALLFALPPAPEQPIDQSSVHAQTLTP
jgi:hypothetical protein